MKACDEEEAIELLMEVGSFRLISSFRRTR
jgi:hypothetical protein